MNWKRLAFNLALASGALLASAKILMLMIGWWLLC
jgi:hypothetical protein